MMSRKNLSILQSSIGKEVIMDYVAGHQTSYKEVGILNEVSSKGVEVGKTWVPFDGEGDYITRIQVVLYQRK